MLTNYLKIAFRSLFKHRLFTFVNLLGLSLGMATCMLIMVILEDQLSFDDFHPDKDRIHRIISDRTSRSSSSFSTVPFPMYEELQSRPEVEVATRIKGGFGGEVKLGERLLSLSGLYVEPTFFELFDFELLEGDPRALLADPFAVVLTEAAAQKFQKEGRSLIGEVLSVKGLGDFKVVGIVKERPDRRTHLQFEALASFASVRPLEEAEKVYPFLDSWTSTNDGYVYLKLKPGASSASLQSHFEAISEERYASIDDYRLDFRLQPLGSITPAWQLENDISQGFPIILLQFMSVLALVILIIACFNYNNLSVACALTRAKEIGLRKVVGAQRGQVFLQFVTEAVVLALLALGLAWCLLEVVMIPGFQGLFFNNYFQLKLETHWELYAWFLLFSLLVGASAGAFPALYLSSFRPVQVLRKLSDVRLFARLGLRRSLVVIQFAVSMVFIIFVGIVNDQVRFMLNKDYGFKQEQVINLALQGNDYEQVRTELMRDARILQVSGSAIIPATGSNMGTFMRRPEAKEGIGTHHLMVDEHYRANMELELVAGKDFEVRAADSIERQIILNETGARNLGFETPAEAVGAVVQMDSRNEEEAGHAVVVVGVVKDFHYMDLTREIGTFCLRYLPAGIRYANIRVQGDALPQTLAHIKATWEAMDAQRAISYAFFDEEIKQVIGVFEDIMAVVGFITLLAMVIACMGLLGMATFQAETRVKEVGIRKVLGASVGELTWMLSTSFVWLLLIATGLALPLGIWLGSLWLQEFAYRVQPGLQNVGVGVGIILLMGMLTVLSQTWRAARHHPVHALRSE